MWKRILSIAGKEFIHVKRDKRTLFIIILMPVVYLVIFGYAASFDLKNVPMAVIDHSNTSRSHLLIKDLIQSDRHDFVLYPGHPRTEKDLRRLIAENKANIGLIIPATFGEAVSFDNLPSITVFVDGSEPVIAQSNLRKIGLQVQRYAVKELFSDLLPIDTDSFLSLVKIKILYNPELRSANFMIPGLAGMILLFVASFLTAMGIVKERERGTLEQIMVSPIKPFELMIGKVLPYILLSFFDFLVILGLGTWIYKVPFAGNLALLLLGAVLFLLCVLGTGLLVSTIAQNQQQAMQLSIVTVFPSFYLSGFIFPLSAIPWSIRWAGYLFPFTYFLPILRGIILKGLGFKQLWMQLGIMGFYGVAIMVLASLRFKKHLE